MTNPITQHPEVLALNIYQACESATTRGSIASQKKLDSLVVELTDQLEFDAISRVSSYTKYYSTLGEQISLSDAIGKAMSAQIVEGPVSNKTFRATTLFLPFTINPSVTNDGAPFSIPALLPKDVTQVIAEEVERHLDLKVHVLPLMLADETIDLDENWCEASQLCEEAAINAVSLLEKGEQSQSAMEEIAKICIALNPADTITVSETATTVYIPLTFAHPIDGDDESNYIDSKHRCFYLRCLYSDNLSQDFGNEIEFIKSASSKLGETYMNLTGMVLDVQAAPPQHYGFLSLSRYIPVINYFIKQLMQSVVVHSVEKQMDGSTNSLDFDVLRECAEVAVVPSENPQGDGPYRYYLTFVITCEDYLEQPASLTIQYASLLGSINLGAEIEILAKAAEATIGIKTRAKFS